eukprot:08554.XXX_44426_44527_1 [CDS] Oithona nana genome sequencing.
MKSYFLCFFMMAFTYGFKDDLGHLGPEYPQHVKK